MYMYNIYPVGIVKALRCARSHVGGTTYVTWLQNLTYATWFRNVAAMRAPQQKIALRKNKVFHGIVRMVIYQFLIVKLSKHNSKFTTI